MKGDIDSFGDMGWLDEAGYLHIADRRTDMVLVGGINIYPAEIEAAIEALPDLARQAGRTVRICPLAEAEREMEGVRRRGARLVALGEAAYPNALQAIDTAPPLIAVLGRSEVLLRPCVAIVGSRNASAAGLKFTARLARDLGEAGFVVVSGLARGIDTAAHEASLATGTIAVLAGGLDEVYPPQNIPLLQRLV